MSQASSLPDLRGQWIDLVPVQGPVQLLDRPRQMIDSYVTIWQREAQLWAGDGFGSVNAAGIVTLYDQKARYVAGGILWPGENGLNVYIRTVDLAGQWIDQDGAIHAMAQLAAPVDLTQTQAILTTDAQGTITGHQVRLRKRSNGDSCAGRLSDDCFQIEWADGRRWQRHLDLAGWWISIKNKQEFLIRCDGLNVSIGNVTGIIEPGIWYVQSLEQAFPDNKTKGGIDLDSTAIHWTDYVGWQRRFFLQGTWCDSSGRCYELSQQSIQDPTEYRRFVWVFDVDGATVGMQMRNWVAITRNNQTINGLIDYASTQIFWENDDLWHKQ